MINFFNRWHWSTPPKDILAYHKAFFSPVNFYCRDSLIRSNIHPMNSLYCGPGSRTMSEAKSSGDILFPKVSFDSVNELRGEMMERISDPGKIQTSPRSILSGTPASFWRAKRPAVWACFKMLKALRRGNNFSTYFWDRTQACLVLLSISGSSSVPTRFYPRSLSMHLKRYELNFAILRLVFYTLPLIGT